MVGLVVHGARDLAVFSRCYLLLFVLGLVIVIASVLQLNTVVLDALAFLVGARPEDGGLPHYPTDGNLNFDSAVASLLEQVGRFLVWIRYVFVFLSRVGFWIVLWCSWGPSLPPSSLSLW